jgi:tetratricopeptide (TPR) repeat protein
MSDASILEKLNVLDARSKTVASSDTKELKSIQSEVDKISEQLLHLKKHVEYGYITYEISARLYYIEGKYDEAEEFCDEAIRLVGAEYPDAKWLKRMISNERQREQNISSKEFEFKNLRNQKHKIEGYLAFAVIGLFIFVVLFLGANSSSNEKSAIIDKCVSGISETQDTISTLNDSFDQISDDASNASGSDYDEQASTLDDISSTATDAKQDAPTVDCSQPVDNSSSSY